MKDKHAYAYRNLLNLSLNLKPRASDSSSTTNHSSPPLLMMAADTVLPAVSAAIIKNEDGDVVFDNCHLQQEDLLNDDQAIHNGIVNDQDDGLAFSNDDRSLPSWADPQSNRFHRGYNILEKSKWMAMYDNSPLPCDSEEPWHPDSSHTKLEFCRLFQRFISEEGLTNVAAEKLLNLLKKLLPRSNLPIYESSAKGRYVSCLDRYIVNAEKRLISFDCCVNGDCVFVGESFEDIYCRKCGEERFHSCTARICKSKNVSYESCAHKDRTAKCTISYRPILPLIKDLLGMDLFLKSVNYKHFNPLGEHVKSSLGNNIKNAATYSDILDGEAAKKHLREMEQKSASKEAEGKVAVNLLLGYNYDGCQPFSTMAVNFWPMTLSILNLPPNLRKKVGMGMFLLSIYHLSTGETYVEDFLHRDCFVRELLLLYDGYEIEVNDRTYFVQARLIFHGYDTKAAEHVLRVQASGSLAGCPFCRLVTGSRKNWAGTVNFTGHRYLLPYNHFLRSRGQTQQCCPAGFYTANAPLNLDELERVTNEPPLVRGVGLGCNNLEYERKLSNLRTLCCNTEDSTAVKEFLRSSRDTLPFRWYHKTFQPVDFIGSLYYHFMDYRGEMKYSRVSNSVYIRDGTQALQTGSPVNGVKGLWSFRFLPYADFATQVNWDPFHTLMNVAKNVLYTWKGARPVLNDSLIEYCKYTQSHPELWNSSNRKAKAYNKWEIPVSSVDELNSLDRFFDAFLIPKGYSKDFEIGDIFTQTGYVKGYSAIQFVEVVMDYFIYAALRPRFGKKGYPEQLMKYLILLSEDFAWLLSTNPFSDEDINHLYYRIVELVELHHGLYPTTEALITIHQLIDLPHHIRQLGPLRNWWTLSGERFMSTVKDSLHEGGRSYVSTVLSRHINSELQDIQNYNSCQNYTLLEMKTLSITDTKRHILYPYKMFNITTGNEEEESCAIYCERLSKLMQHDGTFVDLNQYEFSCLLHLLVREARSLYGSFKAALECSPLFRLYCSFSQHKRSKLWTKKNSNKEMDDFGFWLTVMGEGSSSKEALELKNLFSNEVVDNSMVYEQLYRSIINKGTIYQVDWEYCCSLVSSKNNYRRVQIFKKCIANGVEFLSRGINCREIKEFTTPEGRYGQQIKNKRPSNPVNLSLADHCGNLLHYSSWCRVSLRLSFDASQAEDEQAAQQFNNNDDEYEFAQLNGFFRCKLPPGDPILNDIPIASICVRKVDRKGRNLFAVDANDHIGNRDHVETTLKPDILFCAVYNIYPTPIILAVMDESMNPIVKSAVIGKKKEVIEKTTTLLLIQMFRHRTINFYPSTFADITTMKLLTSSSNDHC